MMEIFCGMVDGSEGSSRAARRRRMQLRRIRVVPVSPASETEEGVKRRRLEVYSPRDCENAVENCSSSDGEAEDVLREENGSRKAVLDPIMKPLMSNSANSFVDDVVSFALPKFGMSSVCGRRRDMEDAVAIHPSFCRKEENETTADRQMHYFGVYDAHGCSHVAMKCRERLHEVVKEEFLSGGKPTAVENSGGVGIDDWWKRVMERSFIRMDKEVIAWDDSVSASCRCELQSPDCDAVGSTAVVAVVTPRKLIVANCGDSRAVLCRKGKAIPLSTDHKPDRPDELNRIQEAGGRVIYWEGARVLGVLAMSRAIGDNYLKPYVSSEPEVTITDRSEDDECLILASDGLWDVVSNDTACGVARMCLKGKPAAAVSVKNESSDDRACSDASMLLTKLALARRSADNVSVVVIDLRKAK